MPIEGADVAVQVLTAQERALETKYREALVGRRIENVRVFGPGHMTFYLDDGNTLAIAIDAPFREMN